MNKINKKFKYKKIILLYRAAQKLNLSSSPHRRKRHNSEDAEPSGFCGVLQRSPPPVPPALLRRIGVKEITGVGKVRYFYLSFPLSSDGNLFFPSWQHIHFRKEECLSIILICDGGILHPLRFLSLFSLPVCVCAFSPFNLNLREASFVSAIRFIIFTVTFIFFYLFGFIISP